MRHGVTGLVVDRLPPGRPCVATEADGAALDVYLEAFGQAQAMDRNAVREAAAEEFSTKRIVEWLRAVLGDVRHSGSLGAYFAGSCGFAASG